MKYEWIGPGNLGFGKSAVEVGDVLPSKFSDRIDEFLKDKKIQRLVRHETIIKKEMTFEEFLDQSPDEKKKFLEMLKNMEADTRKRIEAAIEEELAKIPAPDTGNPEKPSGAGPKPKTAAQKKNNDKKAGDK